MGGSKTSFFITDIILLIVFLGLIKIIFDLNRFFFLGELALAIFLICIAFISLIGAFSNENWGWIGLSVVYAILLLNLLFIHARDHSSRLLLLTIFIAVIGFIIAVAKIKRSEDEEEFFEEPEVEEVTTTHEPGKYVASATGSSYHAPNCDWAKKIKEKNRVWFDDEKDAKKRFKPHSCLK